MRIEVEVFNCREAFFFFDVLHVHKYLIRGAKWEIVITRRRISLFFDTYKMKCKTIDWLAFARFFFKWLTMLSFTLIHVTAIFSFSFLCSFFLTNMYVQNIIWIYISYYFFSRFFFLPFFSVLYVCRQRRVHVGENKNKKKKRRK